MIKVANGWTVTNCVEQHFRIDGKIIGKIHRPARTTLWIALAYFGKKRKCVGWRKEADTAKALVEKALVKASKERG